MAQIIPISLSLAKAFLVKDQEVILIDTGCPNDAQRLRAGLDRAGVAPADLRLILHTHAHYDHCGCTRYLKDLSSAPVALHRPGYQYFADDVRALRQSIKLLMDSGASTVHVAHGGPLGRQAILERFRGEIDFARMQASCPEVPQAHTRV